ncbi:small membrane A-kinase anchor protein [Calypte anna]|uniref:small membrane A-kinase anchor protein n=1 Tax=Calypte anna TaxID=9244 RepID=UPI0004BE9393|nr:small membrane A-kinase anchor protein [Calypte anna]
MGCFKSKYAFPHTSALQDEVVGEGCTGDKSSLLAGGDGKGPPSIIVQDYADRFSREILDQALKQLAVTESKYSDIPYIESDVP